MPDLSHQASSEYWNAYPDPSIYRVIMFLESVESWTLDGSPGIEEALHALGQELDNIASIDINKLGQSAAFVDIVGNIKTGRGLRVLQALDVIHPGSASRILMYAEENTLSPHDAAGFFLKRNITFERLRLLSRAFSESRLKMIQMALEREE